MILPEEERSEYDEYALLKNMRSLYAERLVNIDLRLKELSERRKHNDN